MGIHDINPLIKLKPDYIGFRSALCMQTNRKKGISDSLVKKVVLEFKGGSSQAIVQ